MKLKTKLCTDGAIESSLEEKQSEEVESKFNPLRTK